MSYDPSAAARDLEELAGRHPDRHPGRAGNKVAVDYAERVLVEHGWAVESIDLEVLDCEVGPASLSVDGQDFPITAGPYSVPVRATAPIVAIDSLDALASTDIGGAIVLLHGDIAADQLFPKSFDFIDAPEHRRIYGLLETGAPAAVIGATGHGGGMGGGLYPYPLIEDGDFDLPNAYTTDVVGLELAARNGRMAEIGFETTRIDAHARQLFGARGRDEAPRAIVIAHIDSKGGSPGAIDNATGVAALLGVARLLADAESAWRIELVPMNGEDHYANTGEHLFVARNDGRWDDIAVAINMDGIGGAGAGTAASVYGAPDAMEQALRVIVDRHGSVEFGEPWYESDHSIVVGHGRPAVALTSASFRELASTVTHTTRDTLELVDPAVVAATAEFVADVLRSLPVALDASP